LTKFIFDLDGTITAEETLPLIARTFDITDKIDLLTQETVHGNIPFIESFIKRVHLLGELPVSEIADLLENVPLHNKVFEFINNNKEDCIIATGNLNCWVEKLVKKIGCAYFTSEATVENNKVVKLNKILKKEKIVQFYQGTGEKVVFIGDGNNDVEGMRIADVSIASGLTHYPAKSILTINNYLIFSEEALCRQLNQLF
jgi:HAD superfamily phosphoserine phosphatase-like hydrolase